MGKRGWYVAGNIEDSSGFIAWTCGMSSELEEKEKV